MVAFQTRRLAAYLWSTLQRNETTTTATKGYVGANSRGKTYKQRDSFRESTGGPVSRITLCQMPIIFTRRRQLKPGKREKCIGETRSSASVSPKGETALTLGTIPSDFYGGPDGQPRNSTQCLPLYPLPSLSCSLSLGVSTHLDTNLRSRRSFLNVWCGGSL